MVTKGTAAARTLNRARIRLQADAGHTDAQISTTLQGGATTVERVRKLDAEVGLDRALVELPRSGQPRKLDGKQEALLVALVCSEPPDQSVMAGRCSGVRSAWLPVAARHIAMPPIYRDKVEALLAQHLS